MVINDENMCNIFLQRKMEAKMEKLCLPTHKFLVFQTFLLFNNTNFTCIMRRLKVVSNFQIQILLFSLCKIIIIHNLIYFFFFPLFWSMNMLLFPVRVLQVLFKSSIFWVLYFLNKQSLKFWAYIYIICRTK